MSALITTAQLQPALIYLSENDEAKVGVAASKFLPAGVKLADYLAAIWAFAKQHNMGKPHFSSTRLAAALQVAAASTPAQAPVPALKAAAARVSRRAALEPVSARVQREDLPRADSAPNRSVLVFDKDDGSTPWEKRQRRPRQNAVAKWRPRLVAIANGDKGGLDGGGASWWACRKKWFGSVTPAPAMVERFLAWYDECASSSAALPAKRAAKISPAAKEGGKNEHALTKGRPARSAPDGWLEIEAACGGRAKYSARYSGGAAKTNRLGFTKAASQVLAERGFGIGKFVRAFWNPKAHQLALALADKGFKVRAGKDAFAIAGVGLLNVLGKEPIEFVELPAAAGYDVVLKAIGQET